MKKKLLLLLITGIVPFLIGSCGISDENSPESCRFEVSQAIDKGNYDYAIQKLENDPTCSGAFTEEEGKINLAAAYVGKAGFDITTIINDILKSSQTDKNKDNYALFVQAISKRSSGKTINLLERATKLYKEIYGNIDCSDKQVLEKMSDIIKDACFYVGLTNTIKATTSLTLLIGGDETNPETIANLVEMWVQAKEGNTQKTCSEIDINGNGIPDSTDVTSCALKYTTELNNGNNPTFPFNCNNNTVQIVSSENPIFFEGVTSQFTNLNIVVNPKAGCSFSPKTFKRLTYQFDNTTYTVAVTNGYCKTDRQTACNITDSNCYPCPVIDENNNPISVADTFIETINEGTDAILGITSGDNQASAENIQENVTEFKKDMCSAEPTACKCDMDGDGVGEIQCRDINDVQNAKNVYIDSPTQNPDSQQLIADYLQNQ